MNFKSSALASTFFRTRVILALAISPWFGPMQSLKAISAPSMPPVGDLPVRAAMPDALVTEGGQKITTVEQWEQRRKQMKQIIAYYAIGHAPPPPGNVSGRDLFSKTVMDGQVTCRVVHLRFGPEGKLGFDLNIFIPAETEAFKAPFPTIVQPSFSANLGAHESPDAWKNAARRYGKPLGRGYAIVTFDYQQCGLDSPLNYRQSAFFPTYSDYDWGDLAAWAWGMSRCVDYLESQPFADKSKIIAVGHSRLGKAALIAGAFDERFALTAPAGSGCGGTGAYRFNGKDRGGKEGLEDVARNFPQWVGPRFAEFSGQVDKLPFDQHWLLALIAPRLFLATDGLSDPYTNGNALIQSYLAAKPVYALLGVPDHLGINFRPGVHELAPADWRAILDFSDQHLRHLDVGRRFDQLPSPEQFH